MFIVFFLVTIWPLNYKVFFCMFQAFTTMPFVNSIMKLTMCIDCNDYFKIQTCVQEWSCNAVSIFDFRSQITGKNKAKYCCLSCYYKYLCINLCHVEYLSCLFNCIIRKYQPRCACTVMQRPPNLKLLAFGIFYAPISVDLGLI